MLAHLKGAPHLSQQQRLRDKEVDQYHRACALPIASHSSVYSGLLFVKVRARTGGFGLNDVLRLDNTKMQYSDRCARLSNTEHYQKIQTREGSGWSKKARRRS